MKNFLRVTVLAICAIFMSAQSKAHDNYGNTTMGNFEAEAEAQEPEAPVVIEGTMTLNATFAGATWGNASNGYYDYVTTNTAPVVTVSTADGTKAIGYSTISNIKHPYLLHNNNFTISVPAPYKIAGYKLTYKGHNFGSNKTFTYTNGTKSTATETITQNGVEKTLTVTGLETSEIAINVSDNSSKAGVIITALEIDYILFPDGAYKIHWEHNGRGFLAYHSGEDYNSEARLADVTLNGYQNKHFASTSSDVNLVWYLITADDGQRYLFHAATGKFLGANETANPSNESKANKLSTSEALPIRIEENTACAGYYVIRASVNGVKDAILSSGCATASTATPGPVRWWWKNYKLDDGGSPLKLIPVDNVTVSDDIMNAVRAVIEPRTFQFKAEVDGWRDNNPNTHLGTITIGSTPLKLTPEHLTARELTMPLGEGTTLAFTRKYRGFEFLGFYIGETLLVENQTLTEDQVAAISDDTPLVAKFTATDDVTLFYDDDQYSYRIPAIAKTGTNRLVAISDYRHNLDDIGRDNHGTGKRRIDLVMRTSDDNGATWSDIKTIAAGDDNQVGSWLRAFGDAAVAAYGNNILVMCAAGDVLYGSGTTDKPNRMARIYSTDNGANWDKEEMTTKMYSTETSLFPDGGSAFFGSGKLAVDPNFNGTGNARIYGAVLIKMNGKTDNNFVVYSDDFGATWKVLGGDNVNPVAYADEPKVEILPNGQILLSARRQGGRRFNVFTYGNEANDKANGVGTWSTAVDGCNNGGSNGTNGEIICLDAKKPNGKATKILLQSQPKGGSGHYERYNVTIWYKEITDEAQTPSSIANGWTQGLEVCPAGIKSAYSAMCLQANGEIAFFFEEAPCYGDDNTKGYSMVYVPLTIEEITGENFLSPNATATATTVKIELTDTEDNKYNDELDILNKNLNIDAIAAKLIEKYPFITLGENGELTSSDNVYTYTNTVTLPFKVSNANTTVWHNIYWPANTNENGYPVYLSASSATDTYVPKVTESQAYGNSPYNTLNNGDKIAWSIYSVNNSFEFVFKNKLTSKYIKAESVATGNAQNVKYVEESNATAFTLLKDTGSRKGDYALAAKVGETTGYLCSTSATGYSYATHYNGNGHEGAWIEFIEAPDYYTIIDKLNNGLKEFGEGEGKYIANDEIAPIIEAMKNSGKVTWNELNEYKTVVDNIALDEWVKIELTVSNENYGTVSIAGEEVKSKFAPKNKAIELLATPASGYHFVNWTKEGEEVSTDAAYTFTVTEATEAIDLVANFEKNKPVNVVLTDNSNAGSEIKHTFRFVMDDLYGEITADIIANKLKEKYPIIVSLGTNATLTDNGADYTYENTVVLPFRVSNGRGNDAIYYNIYYPVNIDGKPNYLAASSKEHSTHAEKINDDTYIYGDNPTYNTENGNSPIGWAIYSVDGSLTFALKNQETGKFIHVTSVATSNDKNAELTDEAKATAFTIYPKTVDHINYFALAAEVEGTTGYLCSTDNNYDFATHYNSNDGAGAWARIEDPGYYSRWIDWWMGYTIWFSPGDGYCIVTDEIKVIKNKMNENDYKNILLNTFVQYGITIANADATWPTLNINITPEIGGFTAINGEENVKTKRAPEGYQIPIKAIPAEGYHFVNWTKGGDELSSNAEHTITISGVKGDVTTITANFEINTYTIGVTANGEGGSAYIVSPGTTNANIEHGTEVTLTAVANNGYEFVNWTKEGEEVSTDAAYTFTATADGGYTANFVEIKEVAAVRYYRIGYDFDNGGKRYYMQSVASDVANKANALLMTQETGAASIFYYADSKLLSYDKGTYVKEDGGTRGLQAVGTSGTVTITTSQSTGKSTISAPNYLHANQSGTTYFVDHCDSNPDNHAANHNFVLEEVETLPVTISSALHATFYAPVAVAFPEDVKAYVLKAADIPGIETYAWMTSLKNGIIPANTGVIIKGAEGTYYFDIVDNSVENYDKARTEAEGNVLDGTVAKTKITEDAYILANRDGKVGLYPVAKNSYLNGSDDGVRFTNNSHKAYLPVKGKFAELLQQGVGFRFIYDDEETTGIEEFETENTETIYDLQGRKLSEITEPGIYIVNGKKIFVK